MLKSQVYWPNISYAAYMSTYQQFVGAGVLHDAPGLPASCHELDSKYTLFPRGPVTPLSPCGPFGPGTGPALVPFAPAAPLRFNPTLAVSTIVTDIAAKLFISELVNAKLALTAEAKVETGILLG
jgi:hypothetical protein